MKILLIYLVNTLCKLWQFMKDFDDVDTSVNGRFQYFSRTVAFDGITYTSGSLFLRLPIALLSFPFRLLLESWRRRRAATGYGQKIRQPKEPSDNGSADGIVA